MTEKQADAPIAARLAAAILGVGILNADAEHVSTQQAEAEEMNAQLRMLESQKMDQTISALKHAQAMIEPMLKAAAIASAELMQKEAIAVRVGFGGAAQAAGRLMPAGSNAQKSWMSLSTKAKLLGGAGLLGTGYAGYKGMQAARDYVQAQPHGVYGKGPAIMHNVNEYGYPEY